MALASKIVREQVPVPGEPGEWVTLRAVGEKKLTEAAQAKSRELVQQSRGMSEEMVKVFFGLNKQDEKAPEAKENGKNKEDAYDWDILCRSAIIAWTYSPKPKPDEVEDLTFKTKRWIVRQVLEMSDLGDDDEEKNCSSDCTSI